MLCLRTHTHTLTLTHAHTHTRTHTHTHAHTHTHTLSLSLSLPPHSPTGWRMCTIACSRAPMICSRRSSAAQKRPMCLRKSGLSAAGSSVMPLTMCRARSSPSTRFVPSPARALCRCYVKPTQPPICNPLPLPFSTAAGAHCELFCACWRHGVFVPRKL